MNKVTIVVIFIGNQVLPVQEDKGRLFQFNF